MKFIKNIGYGEKKITFGLFSFHWVIITINDTKFLRIGMRDFKGRLLFWKSFNI